jgi:hypothetical protein
VIVELDDATIGEIKASYEHGLSKLTLSTELARELLDSLERVVPPVPHEDAVAMFTEAFPGAVVDEVIVGPMCALCNTRIHQGDPTMYVRTHGWALARRKAGGTHAVKKRTTEEVYAHGACVDRKGGAAQSTID